jgi:hypothetical protein
MTTLDDTPVNSPKENTNLLIVCVIALVTGCVAGSYVAGRKVEPLAARISALNDQIKSLSGELVTTKLAMPSLDAEGYLELGKPNIYQDLGPFWQVSELVLIADPQGCRVAGEILYRLSVRRQNVEMSVELIDAAFKTVARGTAVLSQALPGRYARFSVIIRTDAKLSDIGRVHLKLNENSGTSAALY